MSALGIPKHIAFIPDGNRRWGKREDIPKAAAYEQGARTIRLVSEACQKRGVEWVTFFVFSSENWKRDAEEVNYLIGGRESLLYRIADEGLQEFTDQNIRFHRLGEPNERIHQQVWEKMEELEEKTKLNTGLHVVMAVNYGGQQEIVHAANRAILAGVQLTNVEEFSKYLLMPEMPSVDLLVRSSGENRLSNYLLWQTAYSEFVFVDELWPDFDETVLERCLEIYANRERRYGG